MSTYWPLHEIRLTVGNLTLTPMTEHDLDTLATLQPPDLELDPRATRYAGLDESSSRGVVLHQAYWRSMGTWSPDDWNVIFVVRRGTQPLGLQGLEGLDFRVLRTVDTSSWLVAEERGAGVGTAARRAVLVLAFDHLGAQAAVSSAWHDNHASLGVSRRLGYHPNGEVFMARAQHPDGVDRLLHLRMTLADWRRSGGGSGVGVGGATTVVVEGLMAALPLFDLPAD